MTPNCFKFATNDVGIAFENNKISIHQISNQEWSPLRSSFNTSNLLDASTRNKLIKYIGDIVNSESFSKEEIKTFINFLYDAYQEQNKKAIVIDDINWEMVNDTAESFILSNQVLDSLLSNFGLLYTGDEEMKKICLLSIASLAVENICQPVHIHVHGQSQQGKTHLLSTVKELTPNENKLSSDNVSPKVLFRSEIKPNTLISLNDKIIDENFGELMNQICDKKSWDNGFNYDVLQDGEVKHFHFPPRSLFHISTNKPITDYISKDIKVDLEAVQSKFFSFKKNYSDEQIKIIKAKMLEKVNSKNKNKDEWVLSQAILKKLLATPKFIEFSFTEKEVEKIIGLTELRDFGQFVTFCQSHALLSGNDEVKESDIIAISKLLEAIPRESKLLKDSEDKIMAILIPKAFFVLTEKIKPMCNGEGITKLTGLNKNTVTSTLYELKKREMVEYTAGDRNNKYWYKIKGNKIPEWLNVEKSKENQNKIPSINKDYGVNPMDI